MILDADGKPAGEEDIQWYAEMLFRWVCNEDILAVLIEHGVYNGVEAFRLASNLNEAIDSEKFVQPAQLREHALRILNDRVARIKIAAKVLKDEYDSRRWYDAECEAHPAKMEAWSKLTALGEVRERPVLPDALPPRRDRREVMRELTSLRDELQARATSEALIVRPT